MLPWIVIPVYNQAEDLRPLIDRLRSAGRHRESSAAAPATPLRYLKTGGHR